MHFNNDRYFCCQYFYISLQCFDAEATPIPGAPTNHLIPDPSPHRVHLTPIAPRGGQGPDPSLLINCREQNFVLAGDDQYLNPLPGKGFVVKDLVIAADLPGHTGEAATIYIVL